MNGAAGTAGRTLVAALVLALIAGVIRTCAVAPSLAREHSAPDGGFTTQPTNTPRSSTPPTPTATPRISPTHTSTARATATATARPQPTATTPSIAPNPTAPPSPGATLSVPPTPVGFVTPTPTSQSFAIITPEPTDFPLTGPPPTPTLPSFSTGPSPDLVATGIEVTQGIQNLANDVPLVEGRLTVARVYVNTQDPDVPLANVKGAMAGFRGGQHLGLIYPDNGPISAIPSGGLRTNLDDSLYFYLPPAWTSGEVLLRAFVYSTVPDAPYDQEPEADNNLVDTNVEFHDGEPLKVRLVPLHLHVLSHPANSQITYYYNDHVSDALAIILDLLRLHPIATNDLIFDTSTNIVVEDAGNGFDVSVSQIKPIGHQDEVEWNLAQADDRHAANERIAFFKDNAPEEYQGFRWYGMVDSTVSMGGFIGWASNGGTHGQMANVTNNAIWNNRGGYALAHEIAHLLLSPPEHVACSGGESNPDPAYPYPAPNCQLAAIDPAGYYGFDTYWQIWGLPGPTVISNDPAAAPNQFAFPMMGAMSPYWIDPFYYCRLLDEYGIACDPIALNVANGRDVAPAHAHAGSTAARWRHATSFAPRPTAGVDVDGYIYVSASVDVEAQSGAFVDVLRLVDVAPSAIAASEAELADAEPSAYTVTFDDASGATLASYAVPAPEHPAHDAAAADPSFGNIVAYPAGTAFLRLRQGERVLAERVASANAPAVTLLEPNGGEQVAGSMQVRWEASDADGDALRFTVMYSNDEGANWTPIATDLRSNAITLPALDGIAGGERALVRVIASDGLLTGYDDSDAPFTVPDSAPTAYIAAPLDGASFPQGASIALMGGAFDLEDGQLTEEALRWRSDVDGDLGTGAQVVTRALSRGRHQIMLVATDSSGGSSETAVTIDVGEPLSNQPDDAERERAGTLLLDGRDGGGTPWWLFGVAAIAVVGSVGAGAMAWRLRSRRRGAGAA